jgi:hypothetical protein
MRPILLVFGLVLAGMVEGGRRGPPKAPLPAPLPDGVSAVEATSARRHPPASGVAAEAPPGSEDGAKLGKPAGGRPRVSPVKRHDSRKFNAARRAREDASRSLAPASPVRYLASFFHGGLRAALSAPLYHTRRPLTTLLHSTLLLLPRCVALTLTVRWRAAPHCVCV